MTGDRVVVVGGGLAGMAAAIELAEGGLPVTLLESRPWLGGATWSFGRHGLTIDNGQHAFLRCFAAYRDLLERLGVGGGVHVQDRLDLTVLAEDGPQRIRRSGWPAPLHLARTLAGFRTLSRAERLAVVPAVMTMWLNDLSGPGQGDGSVASWLSRHGQDTRSRTQFWESFLVPILNATSKQADLGTAAAMINAALLSRRSQADIGITSVPLRDLHGGPASRLLARLGADVRVGASVTAIRHEPGGGFSVQIGPEIAEGQPRQLSFGQSDHDVVKAAGVVLAVPAWSAAALVPPELSGEAAAWNRLRPSPVVSIHVMYGSRITELPFAVSTDSPLRWVADKTKPAGLHTGQYLAASIPAADEYVDAPAARIRERFLPALEQLFPAAASAQVEDFFVTRERRATFRPVPGSVGLRPDQETQLPGFALAGAWTKTGWPDTMEGAVRSGRLAAECVLRAIARAADAAEARAARPDARLPDPVGAMRTPAARRVIAPAAPLKLSVEGRPRTATDVSVARPAEHVPARGSSGKAVAVSESDAASDSDIAAGSDVAPASGVAAGSDVAAGPVVANGSDAASESTLSGVSVARVSVAGQSVEGGATAEPATAPGAAETATTAAPRSPAPCEAGKPVRRRPAKGELAHRADKPVALAVPDTAAEHAEAARP